MLISIVSSIIAVVVLVVCFVFINSQYQAKYDGEIKIELVDLDGKILKERDVKFSTGDDLEILISENFDNVLFENGMLMNIENYETPTDWSTFICIYVDNEMSNVGIADIAFEDEMIISLRITEFIYE